jgi:hypothetical protein
MTMSVADAGTKAPNCHETSRLWFEGDPNDQQWPRQYWNIDTVVFRALVAQGFADRRCPMVADWLARCIAAGIVKFVNGKMIIPPVSEKMSSSPDGEMTWVILWGALGERGATKLDDEMQASLLRLFLPRTRYPGGPDRPYSESDFEEMWGIEHCGDSVGISQGHLKRQFEKDGNEEFEKLSPVFQEAIRGIAAEMPEVLEVTLKQMSEIMHW